MANYAFFNQSGALTNVSPRNNLDLFDDREIAYQADYFFINHKRYNLFNPESISRIPVPDFDSSHAAVLDLSYIARIRCGIVNDPDLIPAFVSKTLDLMFASRLLWRRNDYLQVIRNYYRCDMIFEGEAFEASFRQAHLNLFASAPSDADEGEHLATKYYFENHNRRRAEYEAVKRLCPDLVPKTVRGYLQIRTRRTERFQQIQEICEVQGLKFDFSKNRHYCQRYKTFVDISTNYDHSGRSPRITGCLCSFFEQGICDNPISVHGLPCIYMAK